MKEPPEHRWCHYCGAPYPVAVMQDNRWPRQCTDCKQTTYKNPKPVIVVVVQSQPRSPEEDVGLLVIRRAIDPDCGKLAFPGGYIDHGETWQEAAVRELQEETSGLVVIPPSALELLGIEKATNGNLLIFCGPWRPLSLSPEDFKRRFKPNEEVSEMLILHEPTELAWPTHTKFAEKHFRVLV